MRPSFDKAQPSEASPPRPNVKLRIGEFDLETPENKVLWFYEREPKRPTAIILSIGPAQPEYLQCATNWVNNILAGCQQIRRDKPGSVPPMVIVWTENIEPADRKRLVLAGAVVVDRASSKDEALASVEGVQRMFEEMADALALPPLFASSPKNQPCDEIQAAAFNQRPPGVRPDDLNDALKGEEK